jgi:transglutaminase superfamily protein
MKRINKFIQLTLAEKSLLFRCAGAVAFSTVGLRIFPWHRLQSVLLKIAGRQTRQLHSSRPTVEQIKWAVRASSHFIPKATCLPQALAAQYLLVRCGYAADFQIGIARNQGGKLEAHAWVVGENQTVIGEVKELERFTPLSKGEGQAKEHYGRSI